MDSDLEDEELLVPIRQRYYLVCLVLALQLVMNIGLIFSTGWILILFNIPSLLGALSLFSNQIEDIEYNKRGMQMYLVGYTKAVFMLLILAFTSNRLDSLEKMEKKEEEKLEFFRRLKLLCELNSFCDLLYSLLGIFILKLTQTILTLLTERGIMDLSSLLSDNRANDRRFTVELSNFRE